MSLGKGCGAETGTEISIVLRSSPHSDEHNQPLGVCWWWWICGLMQDEEGPSVQLRRQMTMVDSDGLLLYMAHASYEPGTSPLSLWVPIRSYTGERTNEDESIVAPNIPVEGPLDVFERYACCSLIASCTDPPLQIN